MSTGMQPPSSFGLFRSDGGKRRLAVVAPINRGTIRNLRYCLLRGAAQCGIGLAAVMPRRVGLALFGAAGVAVYAIPHPDRERTRKHLKLIYGSTWNGRRIRKN